MHGFILVDLFKHVKMDVLNVEGGPLKYCMYSAQIFVQCHCVGYPLFWSLGHTRLVLMPHFFVCVIRCQLFERELK